MCVSLAMLVSGSDFALVGIVGIVELIGILGYGIRGYRGVIVALMLCFALFVYLLLIPTVQ